MKITIKYGTETKEDLPLILTNENLDDYNFVEIEIGKEIIDVSVEDLYRAIKVFKEIRKDNLIKE